jgi:hypothetical protein
MNAAQISHLLRQASAAHGEYETNILNGVYDQAWAIWYARWLVEHGFNSLVSQPVSAETLSSLLSDLDAKHKATDRRQPWPDYYAERLAARLG